MILQSNSGQYKKTGENKVNIRKNDNNWIEFIGDIFGHGKGLTNHNGRKNKIKNRTKDKKYFLN